MEYEIMYLCNFLGVSVLLAIALFTLVGVDKEKNTDTFEMWEQVSLFILFAHYCKLINLIPKSLLHSFYLLT